LIREVFGAGTITLIPIGNFDGVLKIPLLYTYPVRVFTLAAGALLLMGYLKAFFTWFAERKRG
ncbi:MAG: electron transport complex subunit RsxE, partial [Sphaerochaetaceae bacterium]|nr:electron transport complex subunit RsxE [Sphaerochaetaceae bacterium]